MRLVRGTSRRVVLASSLQPHTSDSCGFPIRVVERISLRLGSLFTPQTQIQWNHGGTCGKQSLVVSNALPQSNWTQWPTVVDPIRHQKCTRMHGIIFLRPACQSVHHVQKVQNYAWTKIAVAWYLYCWFRIRAATLLESMAEIRISRHVDSWSDQHITFHHGT